MDVPPDVAELLAEMRADGAGPRADAIAAALEAFEPPPVDPPLTAADIVKIVRAEAAADVARIEAQAAATTATIAADRDAEAAADVERIEATADAVADIADAEAAADVERIEATADAVADIADADDDPPPPAPAAEGPPPEPTHWLTRRWKAKR